MFEREAKVLKTIEGCADMLLAGLSDDEVCLQPTPGANHAAWVLGHLAYAADSHSRFAGATPRLDAGWEKRYGLGSTPTASIDDYPTKQELIHAWHDANDRLIAAVHGAGPEHLDQPTQGPLAATLPTVGDFLAFSMTGHTATHIGQLSARRRAIGRAMMF